MKTDQERALLMSLDARISRTMASPAQDSYMQDILSEVPEMLDGDGGGEARVFVDGVEIPLASWNADSTKPYLRCDFSTTPPTLTEQTGPVPSTWGPTIAWRPKPLGGGWCVFDRIG